MNGYTQALQKSEARLRAILETTSSIIYLKDIQGNYLLANRQYLESFQLAEADIIGKKDSDIFPPDIASIFRQNDRRVIDSKSVLDFEEQAIVADGNWRTYISIKAPLINEKGEVYALCGISTDIGEQKQTEAELRESAARERTLLKVVEKIRQTLDLESIFQTTNDMIRETLNCDRVAVYRFNADWSGEFVSEARDTSLSSINGTELKEGWTDTCLQVTEGGRYKNQQTLAVENIDEASFTDCHRAMYDRLQVKAFCIAPIFQSDRLWGLLAAYQNQQPRHWKEGEISLLTQTGIQLGISLAQVDLFTQIQNQSWQLQQAKEAAESANQAKSAFIAHTSHELRTPLNAILGFAQILQRETGFDAKQKRGIETIQRSGQHLLTLINDILYIAKIEAGKLNLELTDIFLPFHQLDDRHSAQEGTGLGLSISQNIAEQMGSQIQVTSKVGKGSEFWFDLDFSPAASSPEFTPAPHLDPEITGYQGERKEILVVDDLDNNREVLVNFLTPLGFQTIEANSGIEAIAKTQNQQPDLIILDLVMPETDGLEVTRSLRQESNTQNLPIIIISASTLPADESQCYQVGANAFLPKPLNFDQLLRLLEQYLQLEWTTKDGQARSLLDLNDEDKAYLVSARTHDEPLVLPNTAELNHLLNLAMEGEIRQVLSQINLWQAQQPELIPFVERVRPLAETCKLKKLKELIRRYL